MQIVNDTDFEKEVLSEELPVLVDFYADWCGPCKRMGPVVEALASELAGKAKVVKLNVDEAPQTAERYNVMSIPTFIVFRAGETVQQDVGVMSKEELAGLLR
ncbi:MAG: thioredoxin [Lachnospiraceae bacterium]|nr:thioredoxin [Lachnospiraceae bacterium]